MPSEICCKTCSDLIAAYQRSVRLYTATVREMCGAATSDFKSSLANAERIRLACLVANQIMLDHWQNEHHPGPASCHKKKARGLTERRPRREVGV